MNERTPSTPKAFRTIAQGCRASGKPGRRTVDNIRLSPLPSTTMPQSLSNVLVHIVFSTKERQPFLLDTKLRAAMHKHLAAVSTQLRCPVIKVGGVEDHAHILARQARTIGLAKWVKEMKRTSSLWVKEARQGCRAFQWQAGHGAFSVSPSQSAALERYVARQHEHHRTWALNGSVGASPSQKSHETEEVEYPDEVPQVPHRESRRFDLL